MSSYGRKITLKSSDGESFEVDEAVALKSQTIKHVIEDVGADNGIPLPNVTSKILAKVIEYCEKHVEPPETDDRAADDDLISWDADFVKVHQATLFDLIVAADYLEIKDLLLLTCQTVADMIKGKTLEQIKETFYIKNGFTYEDELILKEPGGQMIHHFVIKLAILMSGWKITLKSFDGESFKVDVAVALESQTIKDMIEDDCVDNEIPLPNVTSKILAKVIEYCKKHVEAPKTNDRAVDEDLKSWDADFVKVDQDTLFDLILAASYLDIKGLLLLTCQTVADKIKGKTPEEIRKTFNIKNDFSPEEDQWAFQ